MCGIAGFSRAEGKTSITRPDKLLRGLAVGMIDRGWDATGFAWTDDIGCWPRYWRLDEDATYAASRVPLPRNGIRQALVHTRMATQGDPSNPDNNHPVIAPGIVLVHNGCLSNDDELFAMLDRERRGQVDSEAIAALLAYGPNAFGARAPELLEMLEGDAAVAWLETEDPNGLHLARVADRPLVLAWTRCGDLIAASTRDAITYAASRVGIKAKSLGDWTVIDEGEYLRVVAGEIVETSSFKVPERWWERYSNYTASYTYTPKNYTPHYRATVTEVDGKTTYSYERVEEDVSADVRQRSTLGIPADSLEDPFEDRFGDAEEATLWDDDDRRRHSVPLLRVVN